MAAVLSLLAGGRSPAPPDEVREGRRAAHDPPAPVAFGGRIALPGDSSFTLHEIFSLSPRDGGWTGFLRTRLDDARPWLWVQERMAILESGRVHPPGLGAGELLHVEARDAREALWAMEEGLRCSALSAVVGELWGDPAALDFTATRRLAVAAERHGVAAYLIRLGGHANLSGARFRWRLASAPSPAHPFNPRAPGSPAWDAELFRARGHAPGRWRIGDEGAGAAADGGVVAGTADRALGENRRAG